MAETKTLQINVTASDGNTYDAGTPASKLPKSVQEEISGGIGDTAYQAPTEADTSVGAGAYDGSDWTVKALKAEVDKRNEDVPEEDQIVVPEPGNKAELVQALEEYDQSHPA